MAFLLLFVGSYRDGFWIKSMGNCLQRRELCPTRTATKQMKIVIKIIITFMEDSFMEPVFKWLNIETQARLNYFIIKIQTQVRIRKAKSIRSALAMEYNEKQNLFKNAKYAIKIQCCVRKHLSNQKTAKLAQKIIVKYVPTTGEVYWYHRKTRVHYKNKPKILRGIEWLAHQFNETITFICTLFYSVVIRYQCLKPGWKIWHTAVIATSWRK